MGLVKTITKAYYETQNTRYPSWVKTKEQFTFGLKKTKPTLWEQSYLPEIARGLYITGMHFTFNMMVHILHVFGMYKNVRAAETYQYPEERRPLASRWRSRHRLTKREDGSPKCVACMMCETICPTKCIYIEAGEHPDPQIEKFPVRFDIDILRCCFCGLCVEACPKDAIRMDTGILEMAGYSRDSLIYDKELLLKDSPDN